MQETRDTGSVLESGRSLGEGNSNPFQYYSLGNFMDRGTWWAIVHGSQRVRLDRKTNTFAFTFIELEEPENMFANPSLKNTRTFPKLPALRQNSVSPLQNMKIIEENNQFSHEMLLHILSFFN